jgi:hypothetical protein
VIAAFQTVQMLCPLSIIFLLITQRIEAWMIVGLSLVVGVTDALSMPSFQSIAPSILKREQIASGLALNSTQFNLSRILGPALAGVLILASDWSRASPSTWRRTFRSSVSLCGFCRVVMGAACPSDARWRGDDHQQHGCEFSIAGQRPPASSRSNGEPLHARDSGRGVGGRCSHWRGSDPSGRETSAAVRRSAGGGTASDRGKSLESDTASSTGHSASDASVATQAERIARVLARASQS